MATPPGSDSPPPPAQPPAPVPPDSPPGEAPTQTRRSVEEMWGSIRGSLAERQPDDRSSIISRATDPAHQLDTDHGALGAAGQSSSTPSLDAHRRSSRDPTMMPVVQQVKARKAEQEAKEKKSGKKKRRGKKRKSSPDIHPRKQPPRDDRGGGGGGGLGLPGHSAIPV